MGVLGAPRALSPEIRLLNVVGQVCLCATDADRERLRLAVETMPGRAITGAEQALLAAAEGWLAGRIALPALSTALDAAVAERLPPRRQRPAGEPTLFPANPTYAALAAEALEDR